MVSHYLKIYIRRKILFYKRSYNHPTFLDVDVAIKFFSKSYMKNF